MKKINPNHIIGKFQDRKGSNLKINRFNIEKRIISMPTIPHNLINYFKTSSKIYMLGE